MKSYKYICIIFTALWILASGCNRGRSIPQCHDNIQNGNESGIDCGGVCSACLTCSDSIQNQGETAIDCGGPCHSCPVQYPKSGLYGNNILRPDGATVYAGNSCSASAEVSANSSVRIVIKNTSDDNSGWTYKTVSVQGWTVDPYNQAGKSQQFLAIGKKSCHVELIFSGDGSADIEIYENGATTPTSKRSIWWH